MGTAGKHWERRDIKWKKEIQSWLKARCPAKEHGYARRKELLDELNATFGTDFSEKAFVTHCYESGIQLGYATSNSNVPRGEKHWRHRPIGSLQEKKGYLRIKVAEPNKWMQYQRYVWEQNHPGESADGMTVIFMDGDNRNFDPANLERVTRGELSVMSSFGHTKDMTRDERTTCLLRARLSIARSKILGREKAAAFHRKLYYEKVRNTPKFKAKQKEYHKRRMAAIMADPERREEQNRKQREYKKRKREEKHSEKHKNRLD